MGRFFVFAAVVAALALPASAPARVLGSMSTTEPAVLLEMLSGWPVEPMYEQHPVRGSFMDPRANPAMPVYHTGVDIAVRDDRPEPDHPPGRTHRVYALEGGVVWTQDDVEERGCNERIVRVGRFGYGHVDPVGVIEIGERVVAGEPIGWTCAGQWHVHFSEFAKRGGRTVRINPLRPGGALWPFRDTARPIVHEIAYFEPETPVWERFEGTVTSVTLASELYANDLHGIVDVRAHIGDPQSFWGWMSGRLRSLRAEHTPYRVHLTVKRLAAPRPIVDRNVFVEDELGDRPAPFNIRYAAGTVQNVSAYTCLTLRPTSCRGQYWFHVFASGSSTYWDTRRVPNGGYELCVSAFDTANNQTRACRQITVKN